MKNQLSVSVVINTIDRGSSLIILLKSLENQTYPFFEVLVVVGPTRDNTLEILAAYRERIRIIRCPTANLGKSRNLGIESARGDIVAFIDDDAVPSIKWLEQIVALLDSEGLDGTGGCVFLIHPASPQVQYRLGIISSLAEQVDVQESFLSSIVPKGLSSFWIGRMMGTNMAYKRSALLEVGGFDEFFRWVYDDSDLALRLTADGKNVRPVKEAAVYHIPGSSRNRQAFTYSGKWWMQTQAAIYFAIKNGRNFEESYRSIAWGCVKFFLRHLLWDIQILRGKKISGPQFIKLFLGEFYGSLTGAGYGFFRARRLLSVSNSSTTYKEKEALLMFNKNPRFSQPAIDPISGQSPSIKITGPPLRICLLSSAYPPARIEGVGRHTHLMAKGLFELGHTVHVITRGDHETITYYDGAYIHSLPFELRRYERLRGLTNLFHNLNYSHQVHDKIVSLILNDGIEIVDSPLWQIDGLVTALSGRLPVVVRLQTAIKTIAHLHKNTLDDFRIIGEMEEILAKKARFLVANSQATLEAVEKIYSLDLEDIPHGIVSHGIVPVADEQVSPFPIIRPNPQFTVLFLGRLEKRKGIMDLFQAIPLVLREFPQTKFIIAGEDNSDHDEFKMKSGLDYITYFQSQYPECVSQVEFKGWVSDEAASELYRTCDLFVAPSLYESFGLIYLEAMNYGKPVIGCFCGGVPEVVEHKRTGLLVDPGAPKALAEAVISLFRSPGVLREMGLAGRNRLLDKFHYLKMARGFERIYREVLSISLSHSNS